MGTVILLRLIVLIRWLICLQAIGIRAASGNNLQLRFRQQLWMTQGSQPDSLYSRGYFWQEIGTPMDSCADDLHEYIFNWPVFSKHMAHTCSNKLRASCYYSMNKLEGSDHT
ncbi:predicted protein [Coccidioides posadasii str. Silveira]|uniref:Predicted protein n=2 Tax=Coccidioides posadasii TaxID=199306 RepID=E9D792_COCPS|nr:predicted protein [Coccidioides posadasii str. Silveira]KMM68448.1 hypothetical protein CPAG_04775 [Coccidioides posadasii RMSCC 3488]